MSEIRHRLEVHRNDALVLLQELTRTAQLHAGFRLAGAVGHLARAQVLLAEELEGLLGRSKEEATSGRFGAPSPESQDDTPVDGIKGV